MADKVAPEAPPAPGQTWQQQSLGGSNPEDLIAVVSPSGQAGTVRRADLAEAMDNGFRLEHPEEVHERKLEKAYGDRPIQTFLESGLSTATFGLSDYLGGEGLRERRERNEGAALAGGIAGAFVPTGAGGLLAGAGRAAEGLATKALGESFLGRVGAAGARFATEGVGYGVGAGVSQVALAEDPMTWEGAAATIGSNALGGALFGGGLGVAGKLLAEGATVAKGIANKQVEALTKGEDAVNRGAHPDVAVMDSPTASKALAEQRAIDKAAANTELAEAKAAHEAEKGRLKLDQDARAKQLYSEAEAFKNEVRLPENFIPSADAETRAMLGGATGKIMKGLNNEAGFIQKRGAGKFMEGLQEQHTVLKRVLADADNVMANAERESQVLLDSLPRRGAIDDAALAKKPFHEQVFGAMAKTTEEGRFGDRQAYISDVWENMPGKKMSLKQFKAKLAEEWQAGRVDLARGDLQAVMDPVRLEASATRRAGVPKSKQVDLGLDLGDRHFIVSPTSFDDPAFTSLIGEPMAGLNQEQSKLFAEYAGLPVPKGKSMAISEADLVDFRQAVEVGRVKPTSVKRIEQAQALLDRNEGLQAKFAEVQAVPRSEQLAALEHKIDTIKHDLRPASERAKVLEAHLADLQQKSLGRSIAQGLGGLAGGSVGMGAAGPMGAVAGGFVGRDVANKLYDRFVRRIVANNAARGRSIKQAIAGMFGKGAEKVAAAMPHATKIIPAIQYASREQADRTIGVSKYKDSKDPTVNQFRQRARELDSLTQPGPNGTYQVRMQALMELHDRMAGMWAISPGVANGIEKLQQAKWAFLASKLPRNPSPPHLQAGPDTWEASKPQMAKFARIMQVAEDPEPGIRRVAAGTATPDDVETLKTIWPAHYEDIRQQCMDHIAELQKTLPYAQRLNLSILLDTPVDPALTPEALSVYQRPMVPPDQQQKPQAPAKPMPMGSVEPTTAQRLASK